MQNNSKIYLTPANMAPSTIHLKVASSVAKHLGINLSGQFLLGAISPDAVYARVDYTQEDVINTHYRQEGIKSSWINALNQYKSTNNPFVMGYCIHIMCDVLWLSSLYVNLKKQIGDEFSLSLFREDIQFVEKWLCRQDEFSSLWNAISGNKIININYFVSPGEVEQFKSRKYKSIKYELASNEMNYLTLDNIQKFIKKSSSRIAKELK